MGKRSFLVLAVSLCLVVGVAAQGTAFYPAFYERGALVPYAYHDSTGINTVVGISLLETPGAAPTDRIYWSFIDADGDQLAAGSIPLVAGVRDYAFNLAGAAGNPPQGVDGYLIFTYDNNSILETGETSVAISANAFLVNLDTGDAAFIPVIPLWRGDYKNASVSLLNFQPDDLIDLDYGAPGAIAFRCRFFIHPSGDPRTLLVMFTPLDAKDDYDAGMVTTTGSSNSALQVAAPNKKLNVVSVGDFAPAGFTEGSVEIENDAVNPIMFVFALTFWSVVGAEQTLFCGEIYP